MNWYQPIDAESSNTEKIKSEGFTPRKIVNIITESQNLTSKTISTL